MSLLYKKLYNLTYLKLTMIKFDQQVGFRLQNSVNLSFLKFAKNCG